jgi:hypothetical protein
MNDENTLRKRLSIFFIFTVSFKLYLFSILIIKNFKWLGDLFSKIFEVPNTMVEVFSHLVYWLNGLVTIHLSAVL